MARVFPLLLCVLLANTVYSAENDVSNLKVEVVENIEHFRAANPDVKVHPLQKAFSGLQKIRYTLGSRISSDRLVAQHSNNYRYSSPQDAQLKLAYPQHGIGAIVTFIDIQVTQSSGAVGNAYVVSGGIGQRSIGVVVEAKRTTAFTYAAAVYGY